MKKRILALFLAGIMTFTMIPGEAFAAAPGEETAVVNEMVEAEDDAGIEEASLENAVQPEEAGESQENDPEEIQPEETASPAKDEVEDGAEQEFLDLADTNAGELAPLTIPEETDPEIDPETGIPENWTPPVGGLEQPEVISISEEAAASLDVLDITENGEDEMLYRSRALGSQQYSSPWDIYSSNYIYNHLDEKEKQFWDALDVISLEYLTGTQNAVGQPLNGETYYISGKGVTYTFLGLSVNEAADLFLLFTYANPQYYFWDQSFLRTNSAIFPVFYDAFANGTARASETAKVKAQVDAMEAKIAAGATELEKIKIAHDLITQKVKYDHGINLSNPAASQTQNPYHQSAYSVFCTDYTVCAGYTKAFTMLMNGAGIDALSVTSDIHAWNMVALNDSWYQIDCTWDDMDGQYGQETMYSFFNRSTARITGDLDQQRAHQMESCYTGRVPKCTQDSGATVDSIGTYKTPSAKTAAPVITQKLSSSGLSITLSSATSGAEIYYTIDGSNPSSSATRCCYYSGAFVVDSNTTVKAVAVCDTFLDSSISSKKAVAPTYTVTFNAMGGSKVSSQKVTANKTVKKPSNPTRLKYTFDGWYTSKTYKTKWNFSSKKVTKNVTLYAKWKKVTVAKASISKLTNVSGKKMKVTAKKVSGAKGYVVRYAANSKMKSAKQVTGTSVSRTIKGLKKGKTYYVQVRAYKLDSRGKKVYGSWSKTKTVKIQK